jgi:hypothetical protein
MGELKQIGVSSFKSLIIASLPLEYKKGEFCKALVGAPIRFSTTQTGLKMRKIWAGTRERPRPLKNKIEANYSSNVFCFFPLLLKCK